MDLLSLWSSKISSYCHGQRETATDRIGTGVPERPRGHRSANHLIRRFTYVQSAAPAVCNAGLYQPPPSRKGYQKFEPETALSSQMREVLHPSQPGLSPAAGSGRISRISAENQACVHGSCIGPCSRGVFESINITACLLPIRARSFRVRSNLCLTYCYRNVLTVILKLSNFQANA